MALVVKKLEGETEQSAAWWACTGWDVADFKDRP